MRNAIGLRISTKHVRQLLRKLQTWIGNGAGNTNGTADLKSVIADMPEKIVLDPASKACATRLCNPLPDCRLRYWV